MSDQQGECATIHPAPAEKKPSRLADWLRALRDPEGRDHLLEILTAVLLSLATIASAWCAYQATRWSSVQTIAFTQASTARIESVRLSNEAGQLAAIDVGLFTQYVSAESEGNTRLADYLRARFRPEFAVAFDAWIATAPLTNPNAPRSPFQMKQYVVAQAVQAQRLEQEAQADTQKATAANQISDNYVLLVVIFALVLFFAGTGDKFKSRRLREGVFMFAAIVFAAGLAIVIAFPRH